MLGQWSVVAVFEEDAFDEVEAVDDALAEGLADAACATAAPPPTRAPEIARATAAFLSCCRMSLTSFRSRSCRRIRVKRRRLGNHWGATGRVLRMSFKS